MTCVSDAIGHMKKSGIDYVLTVPCDRIKGLLAQVPKHFHHIPLTKEEEGVGICAGLALSGKRPAMLIQNSGIGNMMNALCSLTEVYSLPLPIILSWRGVYKEKIPAQVPMGKHLPAIFVAIGIPYEIIDSCPDIGKIEDVVNRSYSENTACAALISPKVWECENEPEKNDAPIPERKCHERDRNYTPVNAGSSPSLTRYEFMKEIAPALKGKLVVSNIGATSRELYSILDQESNFYMLGSFGLASAVGLGFALGTKGKVVVLDGDGSILANPGTLCTIAQEHPDNLAIICIDNGVHGATGNQPTAASNLVDLEEVARSLGIRNTIKTSEPREIIKALEIPNNGPQFIHANVSVGSEKVPEIPLSPFEIKLRIMDYIRRSNQ